MLKYVVIVGACVALFFTSQSRAAEGGGEKVAAYTDVNRPTDTVPDENVKALAAEIARIISAGKTASAGTQTDAQTEAAAEALAKAIGGYVNAVNAKNRRSAQKSVDMNRGASLASGSGQIDLNAGYDPSKQSRGSQQHGVVIAQGQSQVAQQKGAPQGGAKGKDKTGTDPRGFGSKLMPYYRYTELENGLEVNEMTLFGMFKLDDAGRWAMTYELPIAKKIDYSGVGAFNSLGLEPGQGGGGGLPSGGTAPGGLEADGDTIGMGDLALRFFAKPKFLEWTSGGGASNSIMPLVELTFPTATEDVLGSQSMIVSPGFAYVRDVKLLSPGFVAAMNFFDFDAFRDDSVEGTARYRGRWFLMQPLSRPGPGILDGIYLLPELQPVYDFKEDHFSFWVGPELGKIVAPGRILYLKPGFGFDPDPVDRKWTFELGFRWFF